MTAHSYHPDTHTHGLADGCPRCAEHAEHPIRSLDRENLRRIMVLAVNDWDERPSSLDLRAAASVLTVLERAGHLARTDPDLFFGFLERYGVYARRPLSLHQMTDAQLRARVNEFTEDDPPPYAANREETA